MKGFIEYMDEAKKVDHSDGTYVSAHVDLDTQKKLEKFLDDLGVPNQLPPEEYHATISYSKKGVPEAENEEFKTPITAVFEAWKLFPNRIEGGNYLVAKIKSEELDNYHKRMMDLGATHDFPSYQPHVSVSSQYEGDVPTKTPNFKIVFDKVVVKPLDPNFKPKKKN